MSVHTHKIEAGSWYNVNGDPKHRYGKRWAFCPAKDGSSSIDLRHRPDAVNAGGEATAADPFDHEQALLTIHVVWDHACNPDKKFDQKALIKSGAIPHAIDFRRLPTVDAEDDDDEGDDDEGDE